MSGLLVSVRSAEEAAVALAAGVDVIDLKEPRRGSLGAVELNVVHEVASLVDGSVPLSMACGELRQWRARETPTALPAALRYAKVGLAGCGEMPDWPRHWAAFGEALPVGVQLVAVVYADWRECSAPSPREVLRAAMEANCAALLVDTFHKDGRRLFDYSTPAELEEWIGPARAAGMLTVLAGSLDGDQLQQALALQPDLIAVRGAVCRQGRDGSIDAARLAALVQAVAESRGLRVEG